MHNIKLILAYDGTAYLGWQKTNMGPSIEATLQTVLEQILQQPIILQAASRTDAGVHAIGQVVNFLANHPVTDRHRLKISLNSLLPKDLTVTDVQEASLSFHPTLDCCGKEYRYYLCYGSTQLPHHRFYSWHYPYRLEISEMRSAISDLTGQHDFTAFCNTKKNSHYKDFLREVTDIKIVEMEKERLCIIVKGNHFLYKMVRNIVGTLVYVGRGKISREQLSQVLENKDRRAAGMTAPAHGLFLQEVFYSLIT